MFCVLRRRYALMLSQVFRETFHAYLRLAPQVSFPEWLLIEGSLQALSLCVDCYLKQLVRACVLRLHLWLKSQSIDFLNVVSRAVSLAASIGRHGAAHHSVPAKAAAILVHSNRAVRSHFERGARQLGCVASANSLGACQSVCGAAALIVVIVTIVSSDGCRDGKTRQVGFVCADCARSRVFARAGRCASRLEAEVRFPLFSCAIHRISASQVIPV